MKQISTTSASISPVMALGMSREAVLRSLMLQAVIHHYGAFAVQSARIDDALLDAAVEQIGSAPERVLGTDPRTALSVVAGHLDPDESQGVTTSDLRTQALELLIAAAGNRSTPATDEFVTPSPFGRVLEQRGSFTRQAATDEEVTELPNTSVFVDYDAEGFPGHSTPGAVLVRTTLATIQPDRLCGTVSRDVEQVALIRADGQSAGTIAREDLDVVLEGLCDEAEDALPEAFELAFGRDIHSSRAVDLLLDAYRNGTPMSLD